MIPRLCDLEDFPAELIHELKARGSIFALGIYPFQKRLLQRCMFHRLQCIMLVKFMAAFLYLLVLKQEQMYIFFMIWFSPGVPSARKVNNTFIYNKHDALQCMKQGSCIMHY